MFCGIISTGLGFIIIHSSRIADKIIKNAGNIGTGVVGLVTGLDAALNLGDRLKKGESDSDKNKDSNKKDTDKKEGNNENNENNNNKEDKKS